MKTYRFRVEQTVVVQAEDLDWAWDLAYERVQSDLPEMRLIEVTEEGTG